MPLTHPLLHAELSLATDASDTHIGGVHQQKEVKGWRHRIIDDRMENHGSIFSFRLLWLATTGVGCPNFASKKVSLQSETKGNANGFALFCFKSFASFR